VADAGVEVGEEGEEGLDHLEVLVLLDLVDGLAPLVGVGVAGEEGEVGPVVADRRGAGRKIDERRTENEQGAGDHGSLLDVRRRILSKLGPFITPTSVGLGLDVVPLFFPWGEIVEIVGGEEAESVSAKGGSRFDPMKRVGWE
jgi:hypothetical protein